MGIKGLANLIGDVCPDAIKEEKLPNYFSRKIAIDASMCIYQYLISLRGAGMDLTNDQGEITSHLQGLLSRTIKFLENGIKPVYVFDGKPPELKSGELEKRREKAKDAQEQLDQATEQGDEERMNMLSKRTIRVSKEQTEDAKKLLRLMGVPVIEAPSEAEAQCAELCKSGKVYATATEDMDALTFGTSILLRHFTFSEARKLPIQEIDLNKVLEGMDITMAQFVDICILCGCDFTDSIRGIGPKKAYSYIKKYNNIEGVLKNMPTQHKAPEKFPFSEVRTIFNQPEVIKGEDIDLKWEEVDEEGLKQFLVKEKKFDETRVQNAIAKLKATRKQGSQGRLDSFFNVIGKSTSSTLLKNKKAAAAQKNKKGATSKKGNTVTGKRKREDETGGKKKKIK
jgi:flap endonuclease-1